MKKIKKWITSFIDRLFWIITIFIDRLFGIITILFILWIIGGTVFFYHTYFLKHLYDTILIVLFILVTIAFLIDYSREKHFTKNLYSASNTNTNNTVINWNDVISFWKLGIYSLVIFTLIWLHSIVISLTSTFIDIILDDHTVLNPAYHIPLAVYCFLLFIAIFAFLTSFKTSLMVKEDKYHFYYGLIQIVSLVVLVTAVLSSVSYVIYIFSSRFLNGKDTLDLIKWSIGALGLGLNAFNIKLFVDYFRGAKVNAPYSLEQLQQLQILQQMQENIEDTDKPEKKLSQEKIMNQEDIKSQIKNVKDSGNL